MNYGLGSEGGRERRTDGPDCLIEVMVVGWDGCMGDIFLRVHVWGLVRR